MNQIIAELPEDKQSLVYALEENESEQAAILTELMYRQGFIDGFKVRCKLSKLLHT
ncbi:MAG: hypothetical protein K0R28_4947 [Paenibacillus sp.]|jgi:hypothetical protein|nr:hypothetical protein [Paenibacillus sp.]